MSNENIPLPHPTEIEGIYSYSTMEDFIAAGGQRPEPSDERYTVSCPSSEYGGAMAGVRNAIEAMDSFLGLFLEGGWTVFVWDNQEEVGWAYPHVGPGWHQHFTFKDLNSPGARAYREHGLDVHQKLKSLKKKSAKKKATKKKAAKKKAAKKKAARKKVARKYS